MKRKYKILFYCLFVMGICLCLGLNYFMEKKTVTLEEKNQEEYLAQRKTQREQKIVPQEEYQKIIEEQVTSNKKKKEANDNWHSQTVKIKESYENTYVVVFYTESSNTPKEALIYSPDWKQFYSAVSLNENQSGEIIFELKSPQKGIWTILLLEEGYMGTYLPYVIEKNEYELRKVGPSEDRVVPY